MYFLGFVKGSSTAWCNKKQLAWMDDISGTNGIANSFTEIDASNKNKISKYEFEFRLMYKNITFTPSYIEFDADSQFFMGYITVDGVGSASSGIRIQNGKRAILNKEFTASTAYDVYTVMVNIIPKNTYLQITYRLSSSVQGSQQILDSNPIALGVLIHIYK